MIDPSLRLRRAIINADTLLVRRILLSHPHLLHNPDTTTLTTGSPGQSNTSLHLASSLGFLPIVHLLLTLNHEGPLSPTTNTAPTPSLNESHSTPLHLAASAGHAEVVHLLCTTCPSSISKQDSRGRDALMLAAMGGHDTIVQILLTVAGERMHDLLDQADMDGNTALHFASMYGHLLVLRTLLAAGADSERRNGWSWKAVSYSATVQAEVYFKGLVSEVERRKNARREAQERKTGGALRILSGGDGEELT